MDLGSETRSPSSPAPAADLAWPARPRSCAEGCRVTICARGEARLAEAVGRIARRRRRDDRVLAVAADLASEPGVARVVARTVEAFGGLDILVNNVGLAGGRTITDTTDAEWQEAIDQTLFPAIRASRLAVPHMRRRGGGAIVMIASIWGRESGGRMTYNAVKAAEISLAKSLAQQLARDNIRVNSVAPGSILFPGGSWHRRQQQDPAAIAEFVRTRTAVRTIRPRRRSRSGGRVPRVAARQLDQRRQPARRRLPVTLADLISGRQSPSRPLRQCRHSRRTRTPDRLSLLPSALMLSRRFGSTRHRPESPPG